MPTFALKGRLEEEIFMDQSKMKETYEDFPFLLFFSGSLITSLVLIIIEFIFTVLTIRNDFNSDIDLFLYNVRLWPIIIIAMVLLFGWLAHKQRKTYYYNDRSIRIQYAPHINQIETIEINKRSIAIDQEIPRIRISNNRKKYAKYFASRFSTIQNSDILLISIKGEREKTISRSIMMRLETDQIPKYLAIPKEVMERTGNITQRRKYNDMNY